MSYLPVSWKDKENVMEYVSCVCTTVNKKAKNENQYSRKLQMIMRVHLIELNARIMNAKKLTIAAKMKAKLTIAFAANEFEKRKDAIYETGIPAHTVKICIVMYIAQVVISNG